MKTDIMVELIKIRELVKDFREAKPDKKWMLVLREVVSLKKSCVNKQTEELK